MDGERENLASRRKALMRRTTIVGAFAQHIRICLARFVLRSSMTLVDWIAPWSAKSNEEAANV